MKKYFLLALFILSTSTFATNLTVFGGANLNQSIEGSYNGGDIPFNTKNTNNGYVVGIEVNKSILKKGSNNLEIGLGTEYDSAIDWQGTESDETPIEFVSFIPVYGDIKYSYGLNKNTNIFLKGKVGYVFCQKGKMFDDLGDEEISLNGKLYTGIGMGVEYKKLSTTISYDTIKYNMQEDDDSESKAEFTTNKISLALGYKFGK